MRKKNLLFALVAVFAVGLIAAGCGSDDSTTATDASEAITDDVSQALEDATVPTNADEALEDAQQQLEDAPENLDQAVQQCIDNVDSSGLSGDQKDNLKKLCESSGDAAKDALESAQGVTP